MSIPVFKVGIPALFFVAADAHRCSQLQLQLQLQLHQGLATPSMSFIPRRVFPQYQIPLSNFKGHHQKALTKFGHLAPQIDVILEVRDCRAPVSTTNMLFDKVLARKDKIVLYSKKDLLRIKQLVLDKWHKNESYLFIDCRDRKDIGKVLTLLREKYGEMYPKPPLGMRAMIIGMPNVGKSTLVNTLRQAGRRADKNNNKKVAITGGQPGVTRSTSEIIRISDDPNILVYDTPGVFLPSVKDSETMLSLALAGCVPPAYIDPVILADYLLFLLNLQDPTGSLYGEYTNKPTNSIHELLYNYARVNKKLSTAGDGHQFDETAMALLWADLWRQGKRLKRGNGAKTSGFLELPAILDSQGTELKQMFAAERDRVAGMAVSKRITDSLGEDGTGRSKHRQRTAKDRAYDLRNQLFK